jgi:hypothetical protein
MSCCAERTSDILLYLDNALTGQKLEDFHAHLAVCSNCRDRLEEELALSSLLRETWPLYPVPQALRTRVAAFSHVQSAQVGRGGPHRYRRPKVG